MIVIFETLAQAGRPLSVAEIGEVVDLPKPTLHRLCTTLEEDGFLIRDSIGGRLRPARRMRVMASGLLMASQLHIARRMVMTVLALEIRETCNFAVPGEGGMTYLDRVDTPWPLRYQLPIGAEVPFHCTASGKMYLSSYDEEALDRMLRTMVLTKEGPNAITDMNALREELKAVRASGHSWDNEEFMAGMVAMAAPIYDSEGRLAATIAFHAPVQRLDFEAAKGWVSRLKRAANDLEVLMFGEDQTS
jgi:DNA-binding IclR family transcriptional regulator